MTHVPPSGRLDSAAALRAWADAYLARDRVWEGGCRFGALAGEVLKSDLDLGADVASGFRAWHAEFAAGIGAMRDRGELRADADPERLATVILAAYQGGMLLAQAEGGIAPLRAALDGALEYVNSFSTMSSETLSG